MDPRTVIIRPVVSEKSYALIAEGKYTFRVNDRAHKTQVAHAVEEIFDVSVAAVRVSRVRPKPKRRGLSPGPHQGLEEGDRPARAGRTDRALRGRRDRIGIGMPNRKTKPTSPGRRFATYPLREPVTASEPERKLTEGLRKSGGRNVNGRVTARHRGGGAKRRYRKIDFKRLKDGVPAKVATIEYDPNRSCYIALLHYADGEKRYILAPAGSRSATRSSPGPAPTSPRAARWRCATCRPARSSTTSSSSPARAASSAAPPGTAIQLAAKEGDMVTLRLPSSEMRLVRADCRATVGTLSNAEHQNIKIGKAGRNRHKGKRPQTRGVAMNPVDHPHGGGEAHHTPGGHPVTPWGKPTLGYRTRKKGKQSDRYIVRGRRRGKKKSR